MTRRRAALVSVLALSLSTACTQSSHGPAQPAGSQAETVSPPDSPVPYKVLLDQDDRTANSVDFHVLVSGETKHDEGQKLLEYLYRHLYKRREPAPASLTAHVYTNEAQFSTPPRSPIATAALKAGELGPTFENKIPLEFWQQIDEALEHSDKGWKLEKKIERDDAAKTVTVTQPYTEPGKDDWAEQLSFNMAMNVFTDVASDLFEKVPELRELTFVGRWKDEDVVKITLDRAAFQAAKIAEIEEQIGQLHGRTFLELSLGKKSDSAAAKAHAQRVAGVYKKMLASLKGSTISPKLK
jgi:hypothetical protein